jgi:hypothetical protein
MKLHKKETLYVYCACCVDIYLHCAGDAKSRKAKDKTRAIITLQLPPPPLMSEDPRRTTTKSLLLASRQLVVKLINLT